ncbi:MAG: deoxyribodipyrimidine photolyase [Pirellulales bacterium]|nr:deoxyribodipyrimidine photolyase [Pirellulales bacterium]
MVAARRATWNFGLQRAIGWARELRKPLLVFEPLRCGYRWASDRLHVFVMEGMVANARALRTRPVTYFPYLEPSWSSGRGLFAALARQSCVVVTDDYPCFFIPRMITAAAEVCPVLLEAIDSNGLLPMRAAERQFLRAQDFRRFLSKNLSPRLEEFPAADPFQGVTLPQLSELPQAIRERWPAASLSALIQSDERATPTSVETLHELLRSLPIDHSVKPATFHGGSENAAERLKQFLAGGFDSYVADRNHPDASVTSGLSAYLHFGHISAHEIFASILDREGWNLDPDPSKPAGSRRLWDDISERADSYLDQLVTWRELGFNMCCYNPRYDQYDSLPGWAQNTLGEHASDRRSPTYSLGQFEAAETHDELWNAAQRQLKREGCLHNYLRMLWGKKILEWTPTPVDALQVMIELNNKYAVDGRDPNSYSGIFWTLGRYDRAWGPERPIFGKVRYMSSENTKRKLKLANYLKQFGSEGA